MGMSESTLAFVNCIGMGDPEVVAEILEMLLEKGSLTARQASEEMGVSYPLVLRVINNLSNRGLVRTSKLKGERGRPRKLIILDKGKVLNLIDECIKKLEEFRKAVEKAPVQETTIEA